ncbi:cleavage and polyadenylation specificity factor subunit 2-like [Zophobas morio]|uniref:cleavage and polyadenylation specificity factor subunit 2-like n=1 Tax=Zophobas morio TaxID=2755281 RepID=UPI003082DAFC
MDIMNKLKNHIPHIDATLVSHPDLNHLAGLPYAVGKLGLNCPIYSTLPVYEMGQMFMYDFYESHSLFQDFDVFDLDDVDAAFSLFQPLKYQQVKLLKGKGSDLGVRPLNAGHLLGGAIWVINTDQEEFVYAVDFDHKKGRLLQGADLLRLIRPSLLITDSVNALIKVIPKRDTREKELMDTIMNVTAKNGNVLMPVDTAGRVLELCLIFDQLKPALLKQYKQQFKAKGDAFDADFTVVWLNTQVEPILKFAMSTLEWMNDDLVKNFESSRRNPLDFRADRNIRVAVSPEDLRKLRGPLVVLATQDSLNTGFAKEIFVEWAESEANAIIFTSRPFAHTLAYELLVQEKRSLTLLMKRKVSLEGAELESFISERRKEIQKRKLLEEEESERRRLEEMDVDQEDNESETIDPSLTIKHDLFLDSSLLSNSFLSKVYEQGSRILMYPCIEPKVHVDDYGIVVRVEDLLHSAEKHASNVKALLEKKKTEEDNELERMLKEEAKRCIEVKVTINVSAQIFMIDFESRSDALSILEYLKQISPRQTILINGSEESKDSFVQYFLSNPKEFGRVYVPSENQTVDVTSELNIYQATLTDELLSRIAFRSITYGSEEFELCHVDGVIRMDTNPQAVPSLEPASVESGHNSVFVGEVILSSQNFHDLLKANGIETKFVDGALVCDELVRIRKEEGEIMLEGPVCARYYQIKNLLYSQFAIV